MDLSTRINIILCILSFTLAIISVVTVVITLLQNSKMIEESTRPVVSIYTQEINPGNPIFYLVIKNFGQSTAYFSLFDYDFDFRNCYKMNNNRDYLKEMAKAVLAPGQSKICMLDYQKLNDDVTFNIKYHSGAKKNYTESFTIDLKAGASMPYGKFSTEGKELKAISYALQEMLQKNL